jgi:hypothetical protein
MALIISARVHEGLAGQKPPVTPGEIRECFATRTGRYLLDRREDHQSDSPTKWFISDTYYGRKLKIVFTLKGDDVVIRSACWARDDEIRIYSKFDA